jgi:conjugal transfer pilus assembly protein TraF
MTTERALPAFLAALLLVALAPAGSARAAGAEATGLIEDPSRPDAFYCEQRKLGTWFYCSKPKPKPRPAAEASPAAPQTTAAERLDAVTAELRELKARAILEPTTENVQSYIRFHADLDFEKCRHRSRLCRRQHRRCAELHLARSQAIVVFRAGRCSRP